MAVRRITREELSQLGESQAVEFKRSLASRGDGMKALDAMVNTDSAEGTVLFGVDDDGTPVGVEAGNLDQVQLGLAQHIRSKFDPAIRVTIETLECEGRTLIAIHGVRPQTVPYHEYDGRAFIREGSSNRQLALKDKNA